MRGGWSCWRRSPADEEQQANNKPPACSRACVVELGLSCGRTDTTTAAGQGPCGGSRGRHFAQVVVVPHWEMDWTALQCLEFSNGYVIHHAENALLARQLYSSV